MDHDKNGIVGKILNYVRRAFYKQKMEGANEKMKLKNIVKQKVVTAILLCGLFCSPLVVKAEEAVPEEEVIISEDVDSITSETAKEIPNIDHVFFVGENIDINAMPMADTPNTDPNDARIIPVNAIVNDAITENGQQRWYAFATEVV